jgi:hypothetical protein
MSIWKNIIGSQFCPLGSPSYLQVGEAMFAWLVRTFHLKIFMKLFLFGLPESQQNESNAPFTLADPSDVRRELAPPWGGKISRLHCLAQRSQPNYFGNVGDQCNADDGMDCGTL